MKSDVRQYCRACKICQARKANKRESTGEVFGHQPPWRPRPVVVRQWRAMALSSEMEIKVMEGVGKEAAEDAKSKLEAAGAVVELA